LAITGMAYPADAVRVGVGVLLVKHPAQGSAAGLKGNAVAKPLVLVGKR
jgi:hypothetical protein